MMLRSIGRFGRLSAISLRGQRFIATSRPLTQGAAAAVESFSTQDATGLAKPDIRGLLRHEKNVVEVDVTQGGATKGAVSVSAFPLSPATQHALRSMGIEQLFPVQAACYEHFSSGKDVIVRARTGTGKTLAFALPIVERLLKTPRARGNKGPTALVMAPTRELAVQVANEFQKVAPQLRTEAMYGGKAYATQQRALRDGVDVVVGTPGRLVDLMTRGDLEFANTQCVVLDEADRMLDIGFADEMDQILEAVQSSQPAGKRSQVCLFSATLPTWIQKATRKFMTKERVSVDLIGDEEIKTSESVQHLRMRINAKARARVIQDLVMLYGRTIIFVETKIEAEHLGQSLPDTAALHGDITQQGREAAFAKFKSGQLTALVATDVAARGLDVPDIQLVIQTEPPRNLESYIHRSGRTGRAGKSGTCITLYTNPDQMRQIRLIEKEIGLEMARAGAPQASTLVQATMSTTRHMLNNVSESAATHYTEVAKSLAEEHGGVAALARALALVGGAKSLTPRSLLDGTLGRVTMMLHSSRDLFKTAAHARRLVEPLSPSICDQMEALMLTQDARGILFDLPVAAAKELKEMWHDEACELTTPDHLPALRENMPDQDRGYGGGGSSRDRGFGGGRGYGQGQRAQGGYGGRGNDRDRGYGGDRDRRSSGGSGRGDGRDWGSSHGGGRQQQSWGGRQQQSWGGRGRQGGAERMGW